MTTLRTESKVLAAASVSQNEMGTKQPVAAYAFPASRCSIDFPANPRIGAPSQAGFGPPLRYRPRQQVQGIRPA